MQAGEYGIVLTIETNQDLTGMTAGRLVIVRPDTGAARTVTVPTVASGTQLSYTTVTADFPAGVPGRYLLTLVVDFGASKQLRSAKTAFPVQPASTPT